jgi:hypothetical protein
MIFGSTVIKTSFLPAMLLAVMVSCCGRAACEAPQSVSVCDLSENQGAYNHKLIQVAGFISHDFEDFTLFDPTCRSFSIWAEYGGTRKSDTVCAAYVAALARSACLEAAPRRLSWGALRLAFLLPLCCRRFGGEVRWIRFANREQMTAQRQITL